MKQTMRTVLLIAAAWLVASCGTDPVGSNTPPEIRTDVATTLEYVVGDPRMTITITAEDPDGHAVEVGIANPPARSELQPLEGWAVFTWDPIASDVTPPDQPLDLVFFAEDELGGRSERVVSVLIRAGNGIPRFENSPSVLYNSDSDKPLIFEVRVRDDDSPRVAISMPTARAPMGADFQITGDFTGRFEWTPNDAQRELRVHSVTFTADDGQNETVTQRVSILFRKGGGGDDEETRPDVPDNPTDPTMCTYEDQVRHSPLGSQRTTDDYRVEAMLAGEAATKYDRLVLNWTGQDIWNNSSLQMQGAEMVNEGGTFVGTIPNPLLAPGESQEYYYEICAIDDDSADDESILCGPTSLYHSFVAYSPNETVCRDDELTNSSFETALDLSTIVGWGHHRVCEDPDDYFRMDLQPRQAADVFFTYPFGSQTAVEMFDEAQTSMPVEPSDCSGFTYVFVENDTDEPATRYFRVTGRDTPYQISPFFYTPTTNCAPTDIEPNDTAADAAPITTDGMPTALQEVCNANDIDLFKFSVTQGQEITARALFAHDDGDLDIKLYAPSDHGQIATNGLGTAWALSINDNEEIIHTAAETGEYILMVRGYQTGNTYTASVLVEEPSGMCMDDDSFGDNHTEATAANASAFMTHTNLDVCPGTSDWYSFVGFQGEFIDIDVIVKSGNPSAVSVTAYLAGSPEETGSLTGDTVRTSIEVVDDATYTLEITTTEPVVYDLYIQPEFI